MSILFCTPCYGGQVTAQHFKSCLELREALTVAGVGHDWSIGWNESLIQRARNSMVAGFLKTGFRKLMFIDADIEFRAEDVAKLWNLDADVACGLYAMKRTDAPLSAWYNGELVAFEDFLDDPFPVDFAGTGFMMIDRPVFEKFTDAWPERKHEEGNVGESFAWFDPRVEDGIYLSEDYAFCKDFRAMGGDIIADPSIRLIHHGSFGYGG